MQATCLLNTAWAASAFPKQRPGASAKFRLQRVQGACCLGCLQRLGHKLSSESNTSPSATEEMLLTTDQTSCKDRSQEHQQPESNFAPKVLRQRERGWESQAGSSQ